MRIYYLRYLCLFVCGIQHILCFVYLRLVCPVLPVSLDCSLILTPRYSLTFICHQLMPIVRLEFFSHTNIQQNCSPVQNQNLHGWLYGRGVSNEAKSPWSNRIGNSLHKQPVLLTTPHLGISFHTPNNIRIPRCSVYRKWGVPLKMLVFGSKKAGYPESAQVSYALGREP